MVRSSTESDGKTEVTSVEDGSPSGGGFLVLLGCVFAVSLYVKLGGIYHLDRRIGRLQSVPKSTIESELHRISRLRGLDPKIVVALAKVESSLDFRALSNKGARGVTQVMPENAKRCGLTVSELDDPTKNIFCGTQILAEEIKRVGSVKDALAVYYCGKVKCASGQQYAKKVLGVAGIY